MAARAAAHRHTVEGLVERLGGPIDDSRDAADELRERVRADDLAFWGRVLSSASPRARYMAADTLSEVHTAEAARLLARALDDYSATVRIEVVDSLPSMDRGVAVRALVAALGDEDTVVRQTAAMQLRRLDDRRAVPPLMALVRHHDRGTAANAMASLRRLTGQRFKVRMMDPPERWERCAGLWDAWWARARPSWPSDPELATVRALVPTLSAPAPALRVRSLSHGTLDLKELRGRVVLVNFWAPWCGECRAEMPVLQGLAARLGPAGLTVLGLDTDPQRPDDTERLIGEAGLTFPVAYVSPQVCDEWDYVTEIPVTYIVDRKGRIRYECDGARDDDTFETVVRRLLAER